MLYQGGRVRQSISLDQIEGVSDGFNKSVVRLKNGSAVTIGHGEFRSRADCQAFKQALRDLLDSSVEVGSKK